MAKKQTAQPADFQRISYFSELWRDFKKNKGAVAGLIIVGIVIFLAILSEFIFDYETQVAATHVSEMLQWPSLKHPFGTDNFGRDILIRLLYGARYSLLIGVCSVAVSLLIGSTLGIIAGYFGGFIENIIMRIMDIFSPIPTMLMAVCLTSAFGQGLVVLLIPLVLSGVPAFAQIARAQL